MPTASGAAFKPFSPKASSTNFATGAFDAGFWPLIQLPFAVPHGVSIEPSCVFKPATQLLSAQAIVKTE